MICRKCETEMVLGIATAQTYVGGTPDFPGDTHASTFSAGGPSGFYYRLTGLDYC